MSAAPSLLWFRWLPVALVVLVALALWAAFLAIIPAEASGMSRTLALRTMAVSVTTNVLCALVGVYLVLRKQSLLGDAISHSVLPGLVIVVVLTGRLDSPWLLVAALITGVATAALAQGLHDWGGVAEDSSLGVVYTSLFALGVVLIRLFASGSHIDVDCVLSGSLETSALQVEPLPLLGWQVPRAMFLLLTMLAVVLAFITLAWKELKLITFDPALAAAIGLPVLAINYLLMGITAGVTVASFEAVGAILVTPMIVVPAAAARLLCDRLWTTLATAAVLGAIAAVGGYLAAYALGANVAGMTAAVAGLELALAVLLAPQYGLLGKWFRNLQLAVRIAAEDLVAGLYRLEERQAGSVAEADSSVSPRPTRRSLLLNLLARRRCFAQGWILAPMNSSVPAQLSPQGRTAAQQIVRAHRLWESYLDQHFQLPTDHLHEPAEEVEHYLDEQLQDELATALDGRRLDPHGKQIPARPGDAATPPEPNA